VGVLEEAGFRGRIKIAYDEWNLRGWHHPGFPRKAVQDYADPEVRQLVEARAKNDLASQYTMADALFSASFLSACLRHSADVGMANIAPLVNTRGPLFVHSGGIVRRTHFHAMAMYANELEACVVPVDVVADKLTHGTQAVAVVDAIATTDAAGRNWSLALINRHPEHEVACTIRMKDRVLEGEYAACILAGDGPESFNDVSHPDRVVPVKRTLVFVAGQVRLPPHSLSIVKVLGPAV
jgi:alpha-N-arabinofuranosidase